MGFEISERVRNWKTFLLSKKLHGGLILQSPHGGGGMYERFIKDIKKTLYKTLGKTHLTFEQLGIVIMDTEQHLNNRPLTYVESDGGNEKLLTPNMIMWGQDAHIVEDIEVEENQLIKLYRRLNTAR